MNPSNIGSPEDKQLGPCLKRLREAWELPGQGPARMRKAGKLDLRTLTPRLCLGLARVGPKQLTWGALFNPTC